MDDLRLPRVERSLCGCSLELGTKIVGYLHLFGVAGGFFGAFVLEVTSGNRSKPIFYREGFAFFIFRDLFVLSAVFNMIAVSGVLLYGTKKKQSMFMEPFLITKGTMVLAGLFNFGMSIIARTFFMFKSMDIFFEMLGLISDSYFFTIVYSFYRQIRDGRDCVTNSGER